VRGGADQGTDRLAVGAREPGDHVQGRGSGSALDLLDAPRLDARHPRDFFRAPTVSGSQELELPADSVH
jgi:hypothetical protein